MFAFAALSVPAFAQILDDSTRQVYGVRTTGVYTESDILNGRYQFTTPDTSITNFHNERHWFADTAYHQFLDSYLSATQPLLWQMPRQIGVRPGKHVFDLYAFEPSRIRYFDTRSPYSALKYTNGSAGNQVVEVNYARNVNPYWNVGFDYRRGAADRQINYTNRQDETQINSNTFAFHSSLRSKNSRYRLLANFTIFKHQAEENGGVVLSPAVFRDSLVDTRTEAAWLTQAENLEQRFGGHIFQQFLLAGENLKLYHIADYRTQKNRYRDDGIIQVDSLGNLQFYPVQIDTANSFRTHTHKTLYKQIDNTVGLKGIRNRIGYGAFIRRRDAEATGWHPESRKITQHFAGGDIRLSPIDSLHLTGFAEKQLDGADYRIEAKLRYKFAEFSQTRIFAQPSLTEQRYTTDIFRWDNNFRNTTYDQTRAAVFAHLAPIRTGVRLEASITRYNDLIYFTPFSRPQQFDQAGTLSSVTLSTSNAFGKIKFRNRITLSRESKPELLRVPELFYNGQLYFEGPVFKNVLVGQVGFEGRYWSGYFPDAYMPATQQFVLQNVLATEPFPVIDFFVNAQVKTVTVFLKVNNLAYGLGGRNYFYTPFYPGIGRTFGFGFRWMFFD